MEAQYTCADTQRNERKRGRNCMLYINPDVRSLSSPQAAAASIQCPALLQSAQQTYASASGYVFDADADCSCLLLQLRPTHLSAGNQLALRTLYLPRLPLLQLPVPALYIACGTTGHNGISCSCTLSCPAKLYLVGSGWLCFRSLRVMMQFKGFRGTKRQITASFQKV